MSMSSHSWLYFRLQIIIISFGEGGGGGKKTKTKIQMRELNPVAMHCSSNCLFTRSWWKQSNNFAFNQTLVKSNKVFKLKFYQFYLSLSHHLNSFCCPKKGSGILLLLLLIWFYYEAWALPKASHTSQTGAWETFSIDGWKLKRSFIPCPSLTGINVKSSIRSFHRFVPAIQTTNHAAAYALKESAYTHLPICIHTRVQMKIIINSMDPPGRAIIIVTQLQWSFISIQLRTLV